MGTMDNFNVKFLTRLALTLPHVFGLPAEKRDFDVFNYINPLIGTDNGGANLLIFSYLTAIFTKD